MEEGLSFVIDHDSRVVSWGEQIGQVMGKTSSNTLGKPYHAVFPKLLSGKKDAVSLALARNEKVMLKGYQLKCPRESMTVDIMIEPLGETDEIKGARVTLFHLLCPVLQNSGNTKRFIDIGKTASTLAHGVRNPLNAMKGAVLYLSGKYGKEHNLVEFARIMEDEITRFDEFISKFLSTSLLDSEPAPTDINSVIKRIRVLTSYQTQFYGIKAIFEEGNIPVLTVNPFHLEHAILNVINNAIEAMRSGGTLSVRTRLDSSVAGGPYVVIEVSDTGPGLVKREASDCAFLEDMGKGFGLLITREILRYYGGHLEINSRRAEGTSAFLYLSANKAGGGNDR